MPGHLQKILYTAEAVVEGGREGHARSMDGRLVVDLAVPEAMGGSGEPGTNPEQLFAAGYAACFCRRAVTRGQRGSSGRSLASGRQRLHAPRLNGNRTGRR
jgi:lipoyl-dependent peroxiredoxin